MPNMLTDGVAWFSSQLKSATGIPCVYVVGDERIDVITTPTKARAMVDGEEAVIVDADALDFLVQTEDIALAAGITEPAAGHRIKIQRGGVEETFEVRPPAPGIKCFEPVDTCGVLLRVHAKRITVE